MADTNVPFRAPAMNDVVEMAGRRARCSYCQTVIPSRPDLPFFEFRGDGSKQATQACKVCKCYEVAHHPPYSDANVIAEIMMFPSLAETEW